MEKEIVSVPLSLPVINNLRCELAKLGYTTNNLQEVCCNITDMYNGDNFPPEISVLAKFIKETIVKMGLDPDLNIQFNINFKEVGLLISDAVSGYYGINNYIAGVNKPEEIGNTYAKVTELLKKCRIPAHIKGFFYLRKAIIAVVNDYELLGTITKGLYPSIATEFKTTPTRVERAIRHAIELAWDRQGISGTFLSQIFDFDTYIKGKPTNSEFIATVAEMYRIPA